MDQFGVFRSKIIIDKDGNEVKSGLGGWLILLGFGLVYTPLSALKDWLNGSFSILPDFNDEIAKMLTTPGSPEYHPFWVAFIWGWALFMLLAHVASFYLVFLFFSKRILFPKLFIWMAVVSFVLLFIDAALIGLDPEIPDAKKPLAQSIAILMTWVPYLLMSKRVKATFINSRYPI